MEHGDPAAPPARVTRRRAVRRSGAALALVLIVLALVAPQGASTPAPDPGGDENSQVSLPPAGKEFGFSGPFNPAAVSTTGISAPLAAQLIHQAGGNAVRMGMPWWGMEPTQGQWNQSLWTAYTATYADMLAQGITPHFVLMDAPPWARDPGSPQSCLSRASCHYPPARDMLGQWKQFVAEVARRFPRATIEVWNEPNFRGNWMTGVDPARYAELLAAAYDAARAVNPSVKVMMGGLGASVKPNSLTIPQFLDGAYAASPSLKGHTTALNFHIYPGMDLGAGSTFAQVFQDVRNVRAAYGDGSTPLFISETGATTTGPYAISEANQADLITRILLQTLTMPDVSGVLIYTLVDQPEYPRNSPEYGFGVLRSGTTPPSPKRAYCQLTRAAGVVYANCPPLAIITSGPKGTTNQTSATFSFTATEPGARFECSFDRAPFSACQSPRTYAGLPEASHTFAVRAIDALGRSDPEPITRSFAVDVTPPDTKLRWPRGPRKGGRPRRVRISSNESGVRFECRLDRHPYRSCPATYRPRGLRPGRHVLRARAIDAAGNIDPTPAKLRFRVRRR